MITSKLNMNDMSDGNDFPKLVKFSDDDGAYVVLMSDSTVGVVVATSNSNWFVGEYSTVFDYDDGEDLPRSERITLRNTK